MFCHKCGSQIADGASFCHKCGAKMPSANTTVQTPDTSAAASEPRAASISTKPTPPQTHDVPSGTPKKKKSKKLPIILGVVALAIAAVVFIALNWEGKMDYEATVRAYTPYANSQGLPYTCGEVFDKYIPNAKWKIRQSGDVTYVDISGTAKGTEKELVVTIKVTIDPSDPDIANMSPVSVKVDGRKTSTQKETEMVFFTFFAAYDEKYDDLSNFAELGNEIEATLQGEVTLTERYTNDTAGISFNYPAGWVILDSVNEFMIVEMIDSKNNADSIASFKVSRSLVQDPGGVFTGNEASVREAVNEYATFLDFGDILIGDVPAKGLKYQTTGLKGDDIVTNFWYVIGDEVYQITCSYSASTAETYEPIFNAIMDSYTITATDTSEEGGSKNIVVEEILYKGIPVSSFFDTLAIDVAYSVGLPEGADRDDDIRLYLTPEKAAVESAEVWNTSALTVDGIPLNKNREGLIDILGEPFEEGNDGGGYFMRYHLSDCSLYFELGESDSEAWRISISPNNDVAASTVPQDNGTVSFTDLLGTWQWQGNDIADAALGTGGAHQLTLYSNGTCNGEIATSDDKDFGFVMALSPDNWSFLEYEQILQVSTMTTGWDWDSNGSPIEVPVYKTMNFKVSISGNTLRLENVENPNSKNVEYIKVG